MFILIFHKHSETLVSSESSHFKLHTILMSFVCHSRSSFHSFTPYCTLEAWPKWTATMGNLAFLHSANGVHFWGDLKETEEWGSSSSFTDELLGADWVSLPKVTAPVSPLQIAVFIQFSHTLSFSLCLSPSLSHCISLTAKLFPCPFHLRDSNVTGSGYCTGHYFPYSLSRLL